MTKKRHDADFLLQGSILAAASIISRIIGLIYRVPLANIIGNGGSDYYSCAYEIYNILLLISSFSIPLAVSKLVAACMSKGRRKTAYRVFLCALLFAFCTGSIAFFAVFFAAEYITAVLLATPLSYLALRVLGPTLLIVAIMGVIRGFFQGMGSMVPSAISQIIEQIVNAIVSVSAAYYLYQYGAKVGAVLGNEETYAESYGAAGGTLGTGVGALFGLLFLLFILLAFIKRFKRSMRRNTKETPESYGSIIKVLVLTIVPVLMSTTIYNISGILDQGIFKHVTLHQGYDAQAVSTMWGIFGAKYKVLINIPIAIASALSASSVPSIAAEHAVKNSRSEKKKIAIAIRFTLMIASPCAVGMGVLARPILTMLYPDTEENMLLATRMLQLGAVSVALYSVSTMTNGILQGIDKMHTPVKNAAIVLVLHLGFLLLCLYTFDLHIYAVILANIFFGTLMCILNQYSLRRANGYRQELKKSVVIPLISSLVMGVLILGIYHGVFYLSYNNVVSTMVSIVIGMIIYAIVMIKCKAVTKEELESFPKGTTLVGIFEKLHLM